jgi:hypothetical protein
VSEHIAAVLLGAQENLIAVEALDVEQHDVRNP